MPTEHFYKINNTDLPIKFSKRKESLSFVTKLIMMLHSQCDGFALHIKRKIVEKIYLNQVVT